MPRKRETIRGRKAVPVDLAKYQARNTNSCLNLIFKGATRRYDWMIEAPVVHPSVVALNSAADGGDTADTQRDADNQNDTMRAGLVGVSRKGRGKGKNNAGAGSVAVKDALPTTKADATVAYATKAGDGQVITARTTSQKDSLDDSDMDILWVDDDEAHISSPIITSAEAMASRVHSLHSDESSSDAAVATSPKRKATDDIIDSDAASWKMARKRQQQPGHPAVRESAAGLSVTPINAQTDAKKYSPAPNAEDTRWNIWSVGNLCGKFSKIGFKLDVLREVLKQCDRAGGFKVLTRVNFTSEKLIKEVLQRRDSIVSGGCAPSLWDEEKPWWVWMPEDGSVVHMGTAAEPKIIEPGPRLPKSNKKHGYRARKRDAGDRKAAPKNANATIEGTVTGEEVIRPEHELALEAEMTGDQASQSLGEIGEEDLKLWLDHELAPQADPEQAPAEGSKVEGEEEEVDIELMLDLELALQAELEEAPILESEKESEKQDQKESQNEGGWGCVEESEESEESESEDGAGGDESEVSEEE